MRKLLLATLSALFLLAGATTAGVRQGGAAA